jgi:outer membrane protein assembly factor BamB
VLLVAALWGMRIYATTGEPSPAKFFRGLMITPMVVTALLVVWWLLASRLRWADRLWGIGGLLVVAAATALVSRQTFPGMALIMYGLPILASVWVGWLVLTYAVRWPIRQAGLLALFVLLGIGFSLVRVEGMDGSFKAKFSPRWQPTAEDKLLAELKQSPRSAAPAADASTESAPPIELQAGDWPGFRGAARDGRLTGVRIATDWDKTPPKELWRRRVGPGWSSFAVIGDRLFTQEQRGDDELVVCYDATTGAERWAHRDATRFNEVVAGPGPRGTPTFDQGNLYCLGASGHLNCLDAATGAVRWSRDILADSGGSNPKTADSKDSEAKNAGSKSSDSSSSESGGADAKAADAKTNLPTWGYCSSPLVADGIVSVFAGGPSGKSVLGYHADSGKLAWSAGDGQLSYASTQLATIGGAEQLLMVTDTGLMAFRPRTGELLWQHQWPTEKVPRIVQPLVLGETDVLIGTGMGVGTRRISVGTADEQWPVKELWTTKTFRPYFNDQVAHGDHLFGFDGNLLMCVSLADGRTSWRTRGYGNGEMLLLVDQGLLLVLSETGEVALVMAQPDRYQEIARFKAIEGKTWNHPVVAHGKLFVRNGEEMACFELRPLVDEAAQASSD